VLSYAVLKALLHKDKYSARFCPSETYLEMLKDQFDNDNVLPEMYSSPFLVKYIQGVWDIVVVDGVGQERETDFANHEIGSLIRRRYVDMRTVIITSALGTVDFNRRYGERVSSAIGDMTVHRMV
jgi:DNA replication protein DnaC